MQRLGIIGLVVVVAVACMASTGCGAFENRSEVKVDEQTLPDGGTVVLWRKWYETPANKELALVLGRLGDLGPKYETSVPAEWVEDRFVLNVDDERQRGWVTHAETDEVMLAADFVTGQVWKHGEQPPAWAHER
jgi:hypothetical protein